MSRIDDDVQSPTARAAASGWPSLVGRPRAGRYAPRGRMLPGLIFSGVFSGVLRLVVSRLAVALLGAAAIAGCTDVHYRGYMVPEGALEQLPLGSTQEQVLIVLGTPSTVATISGEVFYYISQRSEQTSFLPARETDRRVIAVYFDKNRHVQRLADYGLKDGKVFDYISRTTPSGGKDANALNLMFRVFKSTD